MSHPSCALGIFAKTPQAGQVKTRLCPPLTPEQAAEFYTLSVKETIARCRRGPWQTVVFFSGDADFFCGHFPDLPRRPQQGANLGDRMEHALRTLLEEHAAAALIGTDTPDLPLPLLTQAFESLQQHEAVIAPSMDGGYVLIGERRHHPQLFRDIEWSTPQVLPETRAIARELQITLYELPTWEDVDDIDDLRRLFERSPDSAAARWAHKILTPDAG